MTGADSSSKNPCSSYTVESERQARLLDDPEMLSHLLPFWGRECSVAEATRKLGRPLNSVHYRVGRLHQAGLLVLASTVTRAGRPIRRYRTRTEQFVVPDWLRTRTEVDQTLKEVTPVLEQLADGLAASRASAATARRLLVDAEGRLHSERCTVTGEGAILSGELPQDKSSGAIQYGTVLLSAEDARRFGADLRALVERYSSEQVRPSRTKLHQYTFVVGMAPAPGRGR